MSPEPVDFSQRADPALLPEWMDEPCSYADMRACLRDLAQVNLVTLAHRPTLNWMKRVEALHRESRKPLHVVDVGCGGGDTLRRIERWGRRNGLRLRLTGIDLNPDAVRAAREFSPQGCAVEWLAADAFSYAPPEGIDIIISSLMTHHLGDAQITTFLRWMERTARIGWFINDLYRSEQPYKLFQRLARVMRWHRFVQHDGPVSIRRSFRVADWERLCQQAGLASEAVEITPVFPARLCVSRLK